MARWTSEDPSGFPDGANNSMYSCNTPVNGLDPNGLKFLCFKGENVTVYSGKGKQGNNIDWGDAGVSWSVVSGGTDGANRIPNGWYSVGEKKALAGFDASLAIGNRSEADFTSNGIMFQGTMAAWDKSGYHKHQGPAQYGGGIGQYYGYDPNDPHDAAIGAPKSVGYKFLLSGAYGNPVTVADGYRIHPKDLTTTHGCVGFQGYTDAVSFEIWMGTNSGIRLLVE